MKKIAGLIGIGLAVAPVFAGAQPVTDVFATFSRTIADRNIFNSSRGLQDAPTPSKAGVPTATQAVSIQFVGTMSYEKGEFAFFQGSSAVLSQVMRVGDKIEGYTITGITGYQAELESADSGDRLELAFGDGLQQDKNKWVYRTANVLQGMSMSALTFTQNRGPSLTPNEPSSASEPNDVLKRLMQQREKENQ